MAFAVPAADGPPTTDPRRAAQQIADLVGRLPREQRLDALNMAQRQVMESLVNEELNDRREP